MPFIIPTATGDNRRGSGGCHRRETCRISKAGTKYDPRKNGSIMIEVKCNGRVYVFDEDSEIEDYLDMHAVEVKDDPDDV